MALFILIIWKIWSGIMQKTIIFAFQGNPLCFIHVLLNALNMAEQGMEGKIILEGEAIKLVPEIAKSDHFLHKLYTKAKEEGAYSWCLSGLFQYDGRCRGGDSREYSVDRGDGRASGNGRIYKPRIYDYHLVIYLWLVLRISLIYCGSFPAVLFDK
jgi:hypothetical protein